MPTLLEVCDDLLKRNQEVKDGTLKNPSVKASPETLEVQRATISVIKEAILTAKKTFPVLDTSGSLMTAVQFALEVNNWKKKVLGE